MRAIVQRVLRGSVRVEERVVGAVERGLVLLVGVTHGDGEAEALRLAGKVAHLRIFEDEAGKMNLSLLDVAGGALVISQFTLYANARRGRRPDFVAAAPPELAEPLVARFAEALRAQGVAHVQGGVFGAHMLVEIWNDGPVTIILDSAEL
ncbi:MAG TPA: D-aminoacyl-tRNA deacylase [Anaerolineae bacterium]|nr:D-aminoacyl-tRNA deacylase [Anaerolineae bacterium]HOQ97488.1 D-aminoacyl-tRNA deacylase [Anaerolineae bacterium]HPL28575.1 D-aminoacyl-tRNA deacylase [Anaerolineae bacterium]